MTAYSALMEAADRALNAPDYEDTFRAYDLDQRDVCAFLFEVVTRAADLVREEDDADRAFQLAMKEATLAAFATGIEYGRSNPRPSLQPTNPNLEENR